jgi:hypothetical protein
MYVKGTVTIDYAQPDGGGPMTASVSVAGADGTEWFKVPAAPIAAGAATEIEFDLEDSQVSIKIHTDGGNPTPTPAPAESRPAAASAQPPRPGVPAPQKR